MRIIIDAMGGDHAPAAMMRGAAQAVRELGIEIIAVGDEAKMRAALENTEYTLDGFTLVQASEVIDMHDDPTAAVRHKKDSSMVKALTILANGEGDAVVSAGSTGALLTGATLLVKRMKGVKRAALGSVIPGAKKPYLLLDCGANVECRADMLQQFGVMGATYMEKVMGVQSPSVALVNNGAEDTKGTPVYVQAHQLLKNSGLNFTGNIEPRDVPTGAADVVVADGFTGNVILKLTEGLAKYLFGEIKGVFLKSVKTKLAYLMVKSGLREFKKKMDADEYGGAPLLGIAKPVIKAHGSSGEKAFKNAIRQAKLCVESGMTETMQKGLLAVKESAREDEVQEK